MFNKQYTTPTGINTTFHGLRSVEGRDPFDELLIHIASYTTEADYLLGVVAVWSTPMVIPMASLGPQFKRSIELWAIGEATSPFFEGTMAPAISTDPLQAAKDKQWALIRMGRLTAIQGVDLDSSQAAINLAMKAIRDKSGDLKVVIDTALTAEDVESVVW